MNKKNRTLVYLLGIMGLIGTLVVSNVLFTMVTQKHFRSGKSVMNVKGGSESGKVVLQGERGTIFDRNGEVIAKDETTYAMTAVLQPNDNDTNKEANYVSNIVDTAEQLAQVLDLSAADIENYMNQALQNGSTQTEFGEGGRGISTTDKERIEAMGLPGIILNKTVQRDYPTSTFASHLIGFAKYDETAKTIVGGMGLEKTLDNFLGSSNGLQRYETDAYGTILPGSKVTEEYAKNGNNVYLTLDHNVQQTLQSSLAKTMEEVKAKRAWGIVMDVKTGKVLGWASLPSFDQNTLEGLSGNDLDVPSNYLYEPGSVMKGITYAAALDSGNYPYNQTYNSGSFYFHEDENGKIYRDSSSSQLIKDAEGHDYGVISFDDGFVRSSNIAICEIMTNYMDPEIYKEYVDKFGFFDEVDIPFVPNTLGAFNFNYAIEKLSTGFGQSISINALQMVQAYSAIVNGGEMVRPYVVDRIVDDNGKVVEQYEKKVIGNPISKETSDYMRNLMKRVVSDDIGTGHHRYMMEDVSVIAKTGTGQIIEDGSYGSLYTNSVMAAAPYDDPKVMVYYVFESSDYSTFTGEPFKETMKAALAAMNITKEDTKEVEIGEENYTDWQEYTMPSFVNHTLTYVDAKLTSINVNKVVIGNGSSVIAQYPSADDSVVTGQKVFLLTDGENITMPNMSGWTKKDVTAFWNLTGIQVTMDGTGSVVSQNISEGTSINLDSTIQVTMK